MLLYWILLLAQKYSEFLQDTLGTSMPALSFAKIHSPALSLLALRIPGCSCLQQISVLWLLRHIICSKVHLELNPNCDSLISQWKTETTTKTTTTNRKPKNQEKNPHQNPKETPKLKGLVKLVLEMFPHTLSQGFTSQTRVQPKRSLWFLHWTLHC